MRRRLFTLASLLSLLLCVATVVLWVRSYITESQAEWSTVYPDISSQTRYLSSRFGRLDWTTVSGAARGNRPGMHAMPGSMSSFTETPATAPRRMMPWWWCYDVKERPDSTFRSFGVAGFYFEKTSSFANEANSAYDIRETIVPYWFITTALLVLPLRLIILIRRKNRIGRCAKCGYDLTGNTSGICPECGTSCTTTENALGRIPAASQGEE